MLAHARTGAAAEAGVLQTKGDDGVSIREHLRAIGCSWRSYVIALRASSRFGRVCKLKKAGQLVEALHAARQGLALLADPVVRRLQGPEGSGLVSLTMNVEWLAQELGEPGASARDIEDSIQFLRSMPRPKKEWDGWLKYLETRAAQAR